MYACGFIFARILPTSPIKTWYFFVATVISSVVIDSITINNVCVIWWFKKKIRLKKYIYGKEIVDLIIKKLIFHHCVTRPPCEKKDPRLFSYERTQPSYTVMKNIVRYKSYWNVLFLNWWAKIWQKCMTLRRLKERR